MNAKTYGVIAAVCLTIGAGRAYGAGSAAAAFLKVGIGARNAAMGETGAAETGANAINWNPAGLTRVEKSELSFMYAEWLEGMHFQNVSFAAGRPQGAAGISATYLSYPSIDKYDNTGIRLNQSFQPNDLSFALGYAFTADTLPLGVSLKYLSSTIDGTSATAVALDAGILLNTALHISSDRLSMGFAVQNLGTGMKFNKESFSLPLVLRLGGSYVFPSGVTLAFDLNKPSDNDLAANAGAEYRFSVGEAAFLAGRAGYRTNVKGLGGIAGITAGVGLTFHRLSFDYAFVPYGDLNDTHRLSLGWKF